MNSLLKEYGIATGIDISSIALGYCRRRGAGLLSRGSVLNLPFASSSFDLLTCFDVLYEDSVPEDLCALREFRRVLKADGRLFVRLPAYDWLRGRHDLVIHTARRYVKSRVVAMLRETGFEVDRASYANTILFPIAVMKRITERLFGGDEPASDLSISAGILNGFLARILALEAPLITGIGLPYGLSVVALARKVQPEWR